MSEKIADLDDIRDERSGAEPGTTKLVRQIIDENGEPKITKAKEGTKAEVPDYGKDKKYFQGFSDDVEFEKETDSIIRKNYPEKFEKSAETEKNPEKMVENKGNLLEFRPRR